jgi:hypothetical protein
MAYYRCGCLPRCPPHAVGRAVSCSSWYAAATKGFIMAHSRAVMRLCPGLGRGVIPAVVRSVVL